MMTVSQPCSIIPPGCVVLSYIRAAHAPPILTVLEPSAILVDVELPDGDGVTLARELAALPWHPRIVLTSINGDITTSEEARNAGARAFVHKAELPNAPLAQLLGGEYPRS